jgi:hypothetical protein
MLNQSGPVTSAALALLDMSAALRNNALYHQFGLLIIVKVDRQL